MNRTAVFLYGAVVYVFFLATFLYLVGFAAGFGFLPKSVDSGPAAPLGQAILINSLLFGLFAVQHFIMARPWFKKRWTQIVPEVVERTTYVLITSLLLVLLFWQWRPMPGIIWEIENAAGAYPLWAFWAIGWVIMLFSTFLIDHFDLFGLRQVYLYGRGTPYTQVQFKMRSLYRYLRHPMMLGFLIAFWATPRMTSGHLLLAIANTAIILIGIQLEERDLLRAHGEHYESYRRRVPMLVPRLTPAAPEA